MNTNPVFRNNRPQDPAATYFERDFLVTITGPDLNDPNNTPERIIEANIQNFLYRYGGEPPQGKSEGLPFRGRIEGEEGKKQFIRVYDPNQPADLEFALDPCAGSFFHIGLFPGGEYVERKQNKLKVHFRIGIIPEKIWMKGE